MASIREVISVEAPAGRVWDAVRDVGAVHLRLLPDRVSGTELDGNVRTLRFPDGAVVRELIVDVDDAARRLAYAVIEGGMPLRHHHATFEVVAETAERCRLIWVTDLLPDDLAPHVRIRMQRGGTDMKRALEAAGEAVPPP